MTVIEQAELNAQAEKYRRALELIVSGPDRPVDNGLGWAQYIAQQMLGDNDHLRCCGTAEPQYTCPETV